MSKINIHRNTFLEKEELNRMVDSYSEKMVVDAMLSLSESFGIVSPNSLLGVPFSAMVDDNSANKNNLIIKGGYIITEEKKAYYTDDVFLNIPNGTYAIKAVCVQENTEPGLFNINTDGVVSAVAGTGVNFKNLLRPVESGVATAVRFVKKDKDGNLIEPNNNAVYQVLSIVDNYSFVLTGGIQFKEDENVTMIILGSIPMGRRWTDEQLEGLYTYNRIVFELVPIKEETSFLERSTNEFYIHTVIVDSGNIQTISEMRDDIQYCSYWKFTGGGANTGVFSFTLDVKPAAARVTINRLARKTILAQVGSTIYWEAGFAGYKTVSGTYTVNEKDGNHVETVILEKGNAIETNVIVKPKDSNKFIDGGVILAADVDGEEIAVSSKENDSSISLKVITGTVVTLKAVQTLEGRFKGWFLDGELLSDSQICQFIIPSNRSEIEIEAAFSVFTEFWVKVTDEGDEYVPFSVRPEDGQGNSKLFNVIDE